MEKKSGVSVVGNGIMGTAIATRLLAEGHKVVVFDVDAKKMQTLIEKGAQGAVSPREAAQSSPFIITSLNTAAIVRAVVFGTDGIAESASSDKMLIDMSSIDPIATQEMSEKLRISTGMKWVDAPLSGGAPKALIGKLTVMVGGLEEDVQAARVIMDSLCANYTYMGPSGAGQTTKLVNQVLCALGFQAVAEAVRLAEAGGVDASRISAALAGGRADSNILQEFGPKMAKRDYSPTGRIDNMLKDLESVQSFALSQRLPLPLTGAVTELHRLFVAAGIGAEDSVAMMKYFEGF